MAADGHSSGSATYRTTSVRPGIYLVDFIKQEEGQDWSITLVLDTLSASSTAVIGRLPNEAETREGCMAAPWPARA